MRTYEEQQQMIAERNQQQIEALKKENENSQEYFERIFHWKFDFKGSLHVPVSINFNPNHWVGTQFEYDKIYMNHLQGKEDEFKIIGEHQFDSFEDLEKNFPIKTFGLEK